ncbi:MAG: quinolinate synthase NadA [archaeon]|nr:quinolinate synthase NadA [archaeon]MCP8305757.1 quinolinate synthase NadA [archaeon]
MNLKEKFLKLKKEKKCLVLGHNYQRPEIQEVSDYLGDSFGLSIKAKETDSDLILFCGVDFMAETAAMLNPDKKVLMPDLKAECPMAKMLNPEIIKSYRRRYPEAAVAVYINTTAVTKAEADVVFTSSNGGKICSALDAQKILVGPDRNLALFIQKQLPDKEIVPIPADGYCYVHKIFSLVDIKSTRLTEAEILVHPEVDMELQTLADFVGSTNQMFNRPKKSRATQFLVGTEIGLIYRMKKEYPDKEIYPLNKYAVCNTMKLNTLPKAYKALKEERPIVRVPEEIAVKAKRAIDRMLEIMNEK